MNIRQIEYILAVAKFKNFGKAAEHCFVTQSTLSTMVNRLEKELNIQIFDRKTKPISITFEGAVIIDQLKVINKEVSNLEELTQNLKGEFKGNISIGLIPTIAASLFPLILNDFSVNHPTVNFQISELTTEKIMEGLLNRDIDMGIVSIPLKHKELLETELYEEDFILYDRAQNVTNHMVEIEDIELNRLWLLEEGHCLKNQVEKICSLRQKKNYSTNLTYKSGSISTLIKLVEHSKGLTLLPYLSTLDLLNEQKEHLHFFKSPVPARKIGLVVHKHFVKKEIMKGLSKTIQNTILPLLPQEKHRSLIDPL